MNAEVPPLTADQGRVLQAIYDHFHDHASWPSFLSIDRRLRRESGIDTALTIQLMPRSLLVQARPGNLRPRPDDGLRLTLLGIDACPRGSEDIERFVRLLRWLAMQEMVYEPGPGNEETMPQVTSEDVAAHLRLHNDELALARLFAILQLDVWGWHRIGLAPGGLAIDLGPDIWRFRDVQTAQDCVRARQEWIVSAKLETEAQAKISDVPSAQPARADETSQTEQPNRAIQSNRGTYIDRRIIESIHAKNAVSQFDVTKLLRLIEELNDNYGRRNSYASHAMLRAILDHVPPVFGYSGFNELANNYSWGRTDRGYVKKLVDFKNQADDALHRQISAHADLLDFDDMPASICIDRLLQECATKL